MNEALPDHSRLTKIRNRYGVEVFRRFFEAIVEQCQQEELVWGKELYMDSTQVNANADLDSLTSRFAVEARGAIQAHPAALFAREDAEIEQQEASAEGAESAPAVVACSAPQPSPSLSAKQNKSNWLKKMPHGMTGWPKAGRSEKCVAIINAPLTCASAPPTPMPPLCSLKMERILDTRPTTS